VSSTTNKLKGGDLRSVGSVASIITAIKSAKEFDTLFKGLFDKDRLVVMRIADAVEKITLEHPEYLTPHKEELLQLLKTAKHIELKWHIAQLATRIKLNTIEVGEVWDTLTKWALDKKESKIVRVFSMQGMYDLLAQYPELRDDYLHTVEKMKNDPAPSIAARIRILTKKGFKHLPSS
jgi:hypothetical protein